MKDEEPSDPPPTLIENPVSSSSSQLFVILTAKVASVVNTSFSIVHVKVVPLVTSHLSVTSVVPRLTFLGFVVALNPETKLIVKLTAALFSIVFPEAVLFPKVA